MNDDLFARSERRRMAALRYCLVVFASVPFLLAGLATAEIVPETEDETAASTAEPATDKPSQSDRLMKLERSLASDEAKLERLGRERKAKAAEFERVNGLRETLDIRIAELRERLADSGDPEQKSAIEKEIAGLERESGLARKHADFLVEAGRTLQEQVETLASKIEADRNAYQVETGAASPTTKKAGAPPEAATSTTSPETANPPVPIATPPGADSPAASPRAGDA